MVAILFRTQMCNKEYDQIDAFGMHSPNMFLKISDYN